VIAYDLSPENAPALEKDARFKVLKGHTTTDVIVAMNNSKKPFSDPKVRQAITLAIDRKAVIQGAVAGYGTLIGSHMDPTNPYYVDLSELYPYNPEKARQLLAEPGIQMDLKLCSSCRNPMPMPEDREKLLLTSFPRVGIKLTLEVIQMGQWIDRVFKKCGLRRDRYGPRRTLRHRNLRPS